MLVFVYTELTLKILPKSMVVKGYASRHCLAVVGSSVSVEISVHLVSLMRIVVPKPKFVQFPSSIDQYIAVGSVLIDADDADDDFAF